MSAPERLRILHVFRAPVGGLFRHVVDLAGAQAAAGHSVGLICDRGGGERAEAALNELAPALSLGVTRIAMPREPGPGDLAALVSTMRRIAAAEADIVHGHGAKGGLHARLPGLLPGLKRRVRVYTPHGGSAHYGPNTVAGRLYRAMEQTLARATDRFVFESRFAADRFAPLIGAAAADRVGIVHNGLRPAEFAPVTPAPDAADLLFIGELRLLKGVDVLLAAVPLLGAALGRPPSLVIVGAGPDEATFRAQAADLPGVVFAGAMPARQAFPRAQLVVVPSRAESLPYVVLEALAAGLPLVASRVGGIPEILSANDDRLVPPEDPAALAAALARQLSDLPAARARTAAMAADLRARFSIEAMAAAIEASYRQALASPG